MQFALKIKFVLSVSLTVMTFIGFTFAQEKDLPFCTNVKSAEKVFVGTFKRQYKKTDKNSKDNFIAEFSVEQPIKGIKSNEKTVEAIIGIFAEHLNTNQIYLVMLMRNKSGEIYEIVNALEPTLLYDRLKFSKKQWQNLSSAGFNVAFGIIPTTDLKQLKKYNVNISADGKSFQPKFEIGGVFTLVFPVGTKVSVSIEISKKTVFAVEGTPGWKLKYEDGHNTLEYDLQEVNCGCDYKSFEFIDYNKFFK